MQHVCPRHAFVAYVTQWLRDVASNIITKGKFSHVKIHRILLRGFCKRGLWGADVSQASVQKHSMLHVCEYRTLDQHSRWTLEVLFVKVLNFASYKGSN